MEHEDWKTRFQQRYVRDHLFFEHQDAAVFYKSDLPCFYCNLATLSKPYCVKIHVYASSVYFQDTVVHAGCYLRYHNLRKIPKRHLNLDEKQIEEAVHWILHGMKGEETPKFLGAKVADTWKRRSKKDRILLADKKTKLAEQYLSSLS